MSKSLPVAYFDDLYAASGDPWGFESRWYERRKFACTLAALPRPRYRSAFEPGCSGGVLSAGLAAQCEQLLCCDIAEEPVRAARRRLTAHANVAVQRLAVPRDWPSGPFDLVVISELAYYFDDVDRGRLWDQVAGTLQPGGTLVTVHWRHPVAEYPTTGDAVHAELATRPEFGRLAHHRETDFLLEVHERIPPPARSVAQRAGLT
ncbi:MAG: SAM-dependent methyltransferase [Pseudonocardiaceae bacterium]